MEKYNKKLKEKPLKKYQNWTLREYFKVHLVRFLTEISNIFTNAAPPQRHLLLSTLCFNFAAHLPSTLCRLFHLSLKEEIAIQTDTLHSCKKKFEIFKRFLTKQRRKNIFLKCLCTAVVCLRYSCCISN